MKNIIPDRSAWGGRFPVLIALCVGILATWPVDFALSAVPIDLQVSPEILQQTMDIGATNPTNMEFRVRNKGPVPRPAMDYTITDNAWWIKDMGSGTVIGDQTNVVEVGFNDMSTFAAGAYTGMITVVAQDHEQAFSPQTQHVEVVISIVALPAPAWVAASDGTYNNKVEVNWAPVAPFPGGTRTYEVWRGNTRDFNEQYVLRLASGLETNTYTDTSALVGEIYYYWVRAVNGYSGPGALSPYDVGYCALKPPEGIWASQGDYVNKVNVYWVGVDGAQLYEVWRADPDWRLLQTTDVREYNDFAVTEGRRYKYKVRAMKNGSLVPPSAYSQVVEGSVLCRPSGLSATQGSVVGRVRLSWSEGWGATQYEIWQLKGAVYTKIGSTTGLIYDDSNVVPGERYTYKVRGRNASGVTEFIGPVSGYAGAVSGDIKIWHPIFLPHKFYVGDSPRVISMRVGHLGGAPATGINGKFSLKYYARRLSDDHMTYIGGTTVNLALRAGESQVLSMPGDFVKMDLPEDDYSIVVRLLPVWPSLFADINMLNNSATVPGDVNVNLKSSANWWGFNDYDGDGISDMAVNIDGAWYVRTVDGRYLGWAVQFGNGMPAVYGLDMDGDNRAEPMVFRDGNWQGMLSSMGYAHYGINVDAPGAFALPGDFTGNGRGNLAAYFPADSRWCIVDDAFRPLAWNRVFGSPGVIPVPGDYDGDGIWDLTIYDEAKKTWNIRRVDGSLILWEHIWGGKNYRPVMGDYDGDGIFDIAAYHEVKGTWIIQTVDGIDIVLNLKWGGPDMVPVPGDYDGDGCWDLAVYDRTTGEWKVRSLTRGIILPKTLWGAPGYLPVGAF